MSLSPEREEFTNESPEYMEVQLKLSENVCRLLQEQVSDLESRLEKITKQLELSKEEAKMNKRALRKCIEEKGKMLGYCKRLANLLRDLARECSSYDRDLQRYMESLEETEGDNVALSAISRQKHLSEEAKLIAEIEVLEKHKLRLLTDLNQAEPEIESLSQGNRYLDDKMSKLLANLKIQQEGPTSSLINDSVKPSRISVKKNGSHNYN